MDPGGSDNLLAGQFILLVFGLCILGYLLAVFGQHLVYWLWGDWINRDGRH